MSLYAHYIKETYDREYLEDETGFITYRVVDTVCHIDVLYIRPEFRLSGKGSALTKQLVSTLHSKIDLLVCEVDTVALTANLALRAILSFGFKVLDLKGPYIRLFYKIEGR